MRTSKELTDLFFFDLRRYNLSNFKTIAKADLSVQDATVHKSFSSVITRYFIFREKHPEVSDTEHRILYFKLKLDMIAKYFSEYPDTSTDNLIAFQLELLDYIKAHRKDKEFVEEEASKNVENASVSDIRLEPDNGVPVEQQQEPLSNVI